MRQTAFRLVVLLGILAPQRGLFAAARRCYGQDEAGKHLNQDVCIAAHVYDVIELADGSRFLDLCSPETADEQCHFTVIALRQDRKDVGALETLRNQQIEIRGTVHSFADRAGIILSSARQLHGGSEKFRPNPALMKGFAAGDSKSAFDDPAFKSGGHHHKATIVHP